MHCIKTCTSITESSSSLEMPHLSSSESEESFKLLRGRVGATARDKDRASRREKVRSKKKASCLTLLAIKPSRWKVNGHLVRFFVQPVTTLNTLPHLQESCITHTVNGRFITRNIKRKVFFCCSSPVDNQTVYIFVATSICTCKCWNDINLTTLL